MKKNIIKSLCAFAVGFSVVSCENNYNEANFEGYDPDAPITDVQTLNITLAEGDYEDIAGNSENKLLAEGLDLSDELKAISSSYMLTEKVSAEVFLPAYLSELYDGYLDLGSSVEVNYNSALESSTSNYTISEYTVSADDYSSVGAEANFTDEISAEKNIPTILAAALPEAGTGDYAAVTYKYSAGESNQGGGTEEPEGPEETTYDNIGDIEEGNSYSVKGTVVVVTAKSFLTKDATGYILTYLNAEPSFVAGDVVTIEGEASAYGGVCQFGSSATIAKVGSESVAHPAAEVLDAAALDAYLEDITIKYVKYTGTLSVSDKYVNINVEGTATAKPSISYAPAGLIDDSLNGQEVDVYGYLIGATGTPAEYVQTMATTIVAAGTEIPGGDDAESFDNIGDIEAGNSYSVKGTVVAVTAKSFLTKDATGYILTYLNAEPSFVTGDVVTIEGEASSYGGVCQFGNTATIAKVGSESVAHPAAEVLDAAALDAYLEGITIKYVKYTGTLSVSDKYVNINVEGTATAKPSISYAPAGLIDDSLNGQEVDVYGYLIGATGTPAKYVQTMATSIVAAGTKVSAPMKAAAAVETLTATYVFDGSKWTIPASTATLTEADYLAMGSKYGNLSNDQPAQFIPKYMAANYPYAAEEDSIDVFYKYYTGGATSFVASRCVYAGGKWILEPTSEVASALFNREVDGWVMDKKIYLTLASNPGMTESYDDANNVSTPVEFTVEGVTFAYTYSYYHASYGSFYILKEKGGYIGNVTELKGLSQVIVTEDYYYNITLSSGTSVDAVDTELEYTKDGDLYIYDIPEGHHFVRFTNKAAFNASADQIQLIYKSL